MDSRDQYARPMLTGAAAGPQPRWYATRIVGNRKLLPTILVDNNSEIDPPSGSTIATVETSLLGMLFRSATIDRQACMTVMDPCTTVVSALAVQGCSGGLLTYYASV